MTIMHRMLFVLTLLSAARAFAGDFGWMEGLSIDAHANPDGFRATLATRFNLDGVRINAVISNVGSEADAYMVLRMAEMSHRPVDDVEHYYRDHRGHGWGRMAKDLGIKPGSREFHALKAGHDLHEYRRDHHEGKCGKEHGEGHGRGHGKEHGHGHGHDDD